MRRRFHSMPSCQLQWSGACTRHYYRWHKVEISLLFPVISRVGEKSKSHKYSHTNPDNPLGVIFKVTIWFESTLYYELSGKKWHDRIGEALSGVIEMLFSEYAGTRINNTLLGSTDAKRSCSGALEEVGFLFYLEPPNSTFFRPSTIWWNLNTGWIRTEINRWPWQSRPGRCNWLM